MLFGSLVRDCEVPKGMSWGSLYGASASCGIGFTMSLFIGYIILTKTLPKQDVAD